MSGNFITDDLGEMMDTDEFADNAVWTPKRGGDSVPLIVFFDEELLTADESTHDVSPPHAGFSGFPDAVSGIRIDDEIQINEIDFIVTGQPAPDGTGLSFVPLKRKYPTRV